MRDHESKDDIDSMLRALGLENFDYRDTGSLAQHKRLRLVKTARASSSPEQAKAPAAPSAAMPKASRADAAPAPHPAEITANPADAPEPDQGYTESLASVFSRLQATAPARAARKVQIDLHLAPRQADRQHTQDERVKRDLSQILSHLSGRSEGINRGQK
ncbi:hypothetical protein ATO7_07095 [Oceanococcus atlanticus]|uniref:Uncharacterized protein n=1 Tax=Oceanococcus atlanticus TaxID=1317117 RepID=A0A1Y1SJ93_9GAMM|nr:hypothetical protein [Oceanococcus atlanticus]ORE89628.1 hypothetical protein ATO7_07095 [Oceanococcus atlanticus]